MSYEGYEQCICKNGHYYERDCWAEDAVCGTCKEESAWYNPVDQTNGPSQGEIPYETLKEKFLVKTAVVQVCNLNHEHQIEPAIFRIPTRREVEPLRVYHKED